MTKRTTSGTTVTEASAQAALRRGATRALTPAEERAMRMRIGAAPARREPLEWMGTESEELEIELRAIEIETWMKMKAHRARQAARPAARAAPRAAPATSRTKEKIVRALRRKGPTR